MAKDASSIPSCTKNFCYCRDRSIEPDSASGAPITSGRVVAPKKLDGMATRLLSGVTAAFFASLERCSCINIATKDDADDGGSLPLIRGDIIYPAADISSTRNRTEEEEEEGEDLNLMVKVEDNKDASHVQ